MDWRGKYGWIQPAEPIDHPMAMRHGGKIYLGSDDVQEELEGVGAAVTFFVYVDESGVGAMNVRPASGAAGGYASHLVDPEVPYAGGKAGSPGGKKGGYGSAASSKGGKDGGWAAGAKGGYAYKGYGGPKGGYGYGPAPKGFGNGAANAGGPYGCHRHKGGKGVSANPEEVQERLHTALNGSVWQLVKQVVHLEPEWSANEMTKRIIKYFYKAGSSPELLSMPWPQAATQFVDHAMQGYSAACGERPWFFELDLAPALCSAIWEVVRVSSTTPRANYPELEQVSTARYEELMDGILTDKAMWEATNGIFGEEPVCNKVYKMLKSSYESASKEVMSSRRPMPDEQRVEAFVRRWMESSMGRAMQAFDGSQSLLTPSNIASLFGNLVVPFGENHAFSCIPAALTENIGRPPRNWPFLMKAARQTVAEWSKPGFKKGGPRRNLARGGKGALPTQRRMPHFQDAAVGEEDEAPEMAEEEAEEEAVGEEAMCEEEAADDEEAEGEEEAAGEEEMEDGALGEEEMFGAEAEDGAEAELGDDPFAAPDDIENEDPFANLLNEAEEEI